MTELPRIDKLKLTRVFALDGEIYYRLYIPGNVHPRTYKNCSVAMDIFRKVASGAKEEEQTILEFPQLTPENTTNERSLKSNIPEGYNQDGEYTGRI